MAKGPPVGAARALPRATVLDTVGVAATVLAPLVARGVIARRPRMTRAVDRLDADRRAVRRLQRLRRRYGPGPVVLRVPGRTMALVLAPEHVHRVLDGSPAPFATANLEKRAALSHFQPHGVLISDAADRAHRRPFNGAVLDEEHPLHGMAAEFVGKVHDEAAGLHARMDATGRLTWDDFIVAWWRVVRRVVLGDAARDDHALTDMLTQLRRDANWAYLRRKREGLRARFLRQLRGHLARAERGSLAHLVGAIPGIDPTVAEQQVPQWLFAYDPAGMATFRALALLASHPVELERVRQELAGRDLSIPHALPLLRASVLESLRLWPTTPAVLRDTTTATTWEAGTLPPGAGVVVYAPLFHRDGETLAYAHRFAPDIWSQDRTSEDWPLIPFSGGPAMCPGRNLVLLTGSAMLAELVAGYDLALDPPGKLGPDRDLPGTLSPYHLAFAAGRRDVARDTGSTGRV